MESEFVGLSLDDDEEEILQAQGDTESISEEEVLSLVGCFLTASIIYYPTMKSTMANLWHPVKVHDVPIDFYSENLAIQLGNFIGIFQEYDGSSLGKEIMNFMRIRVQIDIRRPLKRKKQVMFKNKCSYVRFKYERLTLFCFYCGRLGHNDSFCEAKMEAGVEVDEMGWDLSLRAQSRRAQVMSSVWLREERGSAGRTNRGDEFRASSEWGKEIKFESTHDPILGFNLEGNRFSSCLGKARNLIDNNQMVMEHDMENEVVIGEEGKKRARGDIEGSDETGGRNRRKAEINLMLSAAAKRQADRLQ
ncbi:hypothetical protein Godav_023517 [Gossypium davidsonii]|uniref:Zinc knuckle CX2CX4HX4C domain-containing protein n=1 Tax=Gossypium davidsonii TaxID=34287 RepID=A0A7J8STJ1_GOSDV|nr:hypothetical protein [Gossypium davidsonii]